MENLFIKGRYKKVGKFLQIFNTGTTISFEAYDEDKLNKKAFIYGKVKGMDENYATFYVNNDFSVYAMDKFKVYIPKEGVILKKI